LPLPPVARFPVSSYAVPFDCAAAADAIPISTAPISVNFKSYRQKLERKSRGKRKRVSTKERLLFEFLKSSLIEGAIAGGVWGTALCCVLNGKTPVSFR